MIVQAFSGMLLALNTLWIVSTIALLESRASEPPFRIHILPVLKHRENTSAVTLGLASYITPTTPIGTRFFPISRPLGRFFIEVISPIGSSRDATCLIPSAIASILSSLRRSLSCKLSGILFSLALLRSNSLPLIISFESSISFAAVSRRTLFLVLVSSFAIMYFDSFAFLHNSFKSIIPLLIIKLPIYLLSTVSVTIISIGTSQKLTLSSSTIWNPKHTPMGVVF